MPTVTKPRLLLVALASAALLAGCGGEEPAAPPGQTEEAEPAPSPGAAEDEESPESEPEGNEEE